MSELESWELHLVVTRWRDGGMQHAPASPLVNDFHVKLPRMMYKDHSVPFMAPWPNFLFWLGVGIGFVHV